MIEINHCYVIMEHGEPRLKVYPAGGGDPVVIRLKPLHILQLLKQLAAICWSSYDLTERTLAVHEPEDVCG